MCVCAGFYALKDEFALRFCFSRLLLAFDPRLDDDAQVHSSETDCYISS